MLESLCKNRKGILIMKNIIWSNFTDYVDDFYNALIESQDEDEEIDWEDAWNANDDCLRDERDNLNIKTNDIICIGDIGRWNGRVADYKLIGNNISKCLSSDCDYVEWYCDRYNLRATGAHHDGTNHYLYRERKDNINDTQWDNFLDKIYYGKCTSKDISRYTKSLKSRIAKVYGW